MHTDFDSSDGVVGFFCMKLLGYIRRDGADFKEEMEAARVGRCNYMGECPIYKRTKEKYSHRQLKLL